MGSFVAALPDGIRPSAVVLPVPWERSTSYATGTVRGPAAILAASQQVELYDEELDMVTWRAGIQTAAPAGPLGDDAEASLKAIADGVERILEDDALPLLLGGEHTLTVGAIRAAAARHDTLGVLQIDAHADLRDRYQGDRWSHACTMARVRELCSVHVGVGIRALSSTEAELIRGASIPVWPPDRCTGDGWAERVVESLPRHVWITVDLDGLDPSIVPAVGTPEPGGLGWTQTLQILRACARDREVVGADIVELRPRPEDPRSDFAAARLAYRLIGYLLTRGGTEPLEERTDLPGPDQD